MIPSPTLLSYSYRSSKYRYEEIPNDIENDSSIHYYPKHDIFMSYIIGVIIFFTFFGFVMLQFQPQLQQPSSPSPPPNITNNTKFYPNGKLWY